MLWLLLLAISLLLLYTLLQGAPYVPTKRKEIEKALDLFELPKGSTLVDIGCGDGIVLRLAAERGYQAVGIEINPLLWAIATWRCRRYKQIRVIFGNIWHWHLPLATDGVFLFGAGPFMERLSKWLTAEQSRLTKPVKVVSFGFRLPHQKLIKQEEALFLYLL